MNNQNFKILSWNFVLAPCQTAFLRLIFWKLRHSPAPGGASGATLGGAVGGAMGAKFGGGTGGCSGHEGPGHVLWANCGVILGISW